VNFKTKLAILLLVGYDGEVAVTASTNICGLRIGEGIGLVLRYIQRFTVSMW